MRTIVSVIVLLVAATRLHAQALFEFNAVANASVADSAVVDVLTSRFRLVRANDTCIKCYTLLIVNLVGSVTNATLVVAPDTTYTYTTETAIRVAIRTYWCSISCAVPGIHHPFSAWHIPYSKARGVTGLPPCYTPMTNGTSPSISLYGARAGVNVTITECTGRDVPPSAWSTALSTPPVPGESVADIVVGTGFTCVLTGRGVVWCTGSPPACAYHLPRGAYDTAFYNAVYQPRAASKIAARGDILCMISADARTLSCFGTSSSVQWCSTDTFLELPSAPNTVFESVFVGPTGCVCYTITSTLARLSDPRAIWCLWDGLIGTNHSRLIAQGPVQIFTAPTGENLTLTFVTSATSTSIRNIVLTFANGATWRLEPSGPISVFGMQEISANGSSAPPYVLASRVTSASGPAELTCLLLSDGTATYGTGNRWIGLAVAGIKMCRASPTHIVYQTKRSLIYCCNVGLQNSPSPYCGNVIRLDSIGCGVVAGAYNAQTTPPSVPVPRNTSTTRSTSVLTNSQPPILNRYVLLTAGVLFVLLSAALIGVGRLLLPSAARKHA